MHALRDSILSSILVGNGTTQVIKATVAESLLGPDPRAAPSNSFFSFGYPEYFNRPALYLEGVANLQWQDGPNGFSNPFEMRQLDLGETPQPQARIVNNTIIGKDGRASFNGGSAAVESNDTLESATQTWQGTSQNPLFYSDVGVIGDNSQVSNRNSSSSSGGSGGSGSSTSGLTNFSTGQFLLRFEDGVSSTRQAEILSSQGLVVLKQYDFIQTLLVGITPSEGTVFLHRLQELQAMPEVRTAEPDFIMQANRIPNDPQYPQQSHYDNRGQTGGTVDADIDAPEAWDSFVGSSQTVIAVLDTGVDYNHPDLRANMWINTREIVGDRIDNDGNGFIDDIYGIDTANGDSDPLDDDGHGTHVAGTTAAVGNNGFGVTGVSWNSKIMAMKVLGTRGGATSGIIQALDYLVTMKTRYGVNIVVSNNSYGGPGFSQAFRDAIQRTIDVGIPFVAAAGNSTQNNDVLPDFPASYDLDGIISVAATDNRDQLAGFSSFGLTTVDIAAPGVDVLSTTLGGGYGLLSGTSMASPHVAGVVALLAGAVPGASVDRLKAAIILGADPVAQLTGINVSGARLNAAKSLFVLSAGLGTANTDVDIYQFKLGVGERAIIDIDSANSGLNSVLQVFDSRGVPQSFVNANGVPMLASDNDAAPGEQIGLDSYADFTATAPGVYYAAVSSVGNTSYDPLSSANRQAGKSTGAYRITLSARHLQDFVITAEDASQYSAGDTFTIFGVPDIDGTGSSGRTFEFTFGIGGQVRRGNIPIHLDANWRFPDVAQAITRAINEGLNRGPAISNFQQLPNGQFGLASPLPAVHARALGGIGAVIDSPFRGLQGDKDILLNRLEALDELGTNKLSALDIQQQISGPFTEVNQGLELFTRRRDGFIVFTTTTLGGIGTFLNVTSLSNLGIGHDRQSTNPISYTSLGDGTSEKFVIVSNAAWIDGNNQIIVDPDEGEDNNLDQLLPETGVLATRGASPTILNNVFFNLQTPVVNQESRINQNTLIAAPYGTNNPNIVSKPGDVVLTGSTYQYYETAIASARFSTGIETSPTNVPNTALDQNVDVGNTVRLFVNAQAGQYLPAPGSPLIDSSINSLAERASLAAVRSAMGLVNFDIVAPDYDLVGQLRADDPAVAPPGGLGQNVFKDRGAFDRADFIGPAAILLDPIDNDALGVDQDGAVSVVQLSPGVYPEFRIQLKDGNESTNPLKGIGVNDDSVTNAVLDNLRLSGASIVLFEDGRMLTEGIDYRFGYNATRDEIILTPLAGVWKDGKVYEITVNNKDRFVITAPSGDQISDGDSFTVTDTDGGIVNFEFDTGYRMQLPQGLAIEVPLAGAGAGGIVDGDRFTINDGTRTVTFEFDRNSSFLVGNTPIPFSANSTQQAIAQSISAAISASGLAVTPRILTTGVVSLSSNAGTKVSTSFSRLEQANSTLGLQVPSLGAIRDGQFFSLSDGLTTVVFEFDTDGIVNPGNTRINTVNAASIVDIARLIESAILASPLQLSPRLIGTDTVHLGLSPSGKVSTLTSNLVVVGVSRSISDGQSFSISFGSITKTFEFTSDSTVAAGNIAIPLLPTDTQDTLGVRTAAIIEAAGLGLNPFHVRDGNISIGGTSQHSISVLNAPSIGLFGTPGVAPTTTIEIIGSLVLQVPSRGGIDLRDDATFSITANNLTVVFEFDRNFSGPTLPSNVVIPFRITNTADEIAVSMVTAINAAGLTINSRFIGSGRVDLGLLADNQVDVLDSRLISQRGNVASGEFFTINNGSRTVTFEFVNVSSGGTATAGRVPILFSNASTRDQLIAAIKAAIEGAGLGLTNSVVGPSSLRLLDTPKFVYDFKAAPGLTRTGVSGGANPIQFIQDVSFTSDQVARAMVRALNAAVNTPLQSKIRGNNTLFVENAISISPQIPNFFLRAVEDLAGNNLKPNRVNNETQFTILMPGVALDFGDAPDPFSTTRGRYATLQENDGARHTFSGGTLRLGSLLDTEINGLPTPGANGDGADDDGISFVSISNPTGIFNRNIFTDITVTVSAPGFVDGWIDFNSDGDWDDPSERVLNAVEFTAGALTRTFKVTVPTTTPVSAVANISYARFRVSSVGGLEPSGLAVGGEVEDYIVTIVPGSPPRAINDSYDINEDAVPGLVTNDPTGTITPNFRIDDGVAANDTDADGGTLTTSLVVGPQNAAFFDLRPDGTFTYRPIPNFFGTDTFTYVVSDGVLTSTNVGTVTIVVREVNDAPIAGDDLLTINEDATQLLSEASLLANDSPGNAFEFAQTLRITRVSAVSTQGGSVTLLNGVVTYVPPTDFVGLDTFTYTVIDNGTTAGLPDPLETTATVRLTVRDKNDAPRPGTDTLTTIEDTAVTRPASFFLSNDSPGPASEAAQTLEIIGVEAASTNRGQVLFANGSITYTPAANFAGIDTFFYLVRDNGTSEGLPDAQSSRGTVSVTVTGVNDAPTVQNPMGTINMVEDEADRVFDLGNTFFDPDIVYGDTLTYRVVSNSNPGIVDTIIANGRLTVRLRPDQNGQAVIRVEAKDSAGLQVLDTLTLNVAAVSDSPRLVAPIPDQNINEDAAPIEIVLVPTHFVDPDVLSNGDVLTLSVTNSNPGVLTASIVNAKLRLVLVPDASGFGTITVRVIDSSGNAVEDSFDVAVAPVNDAPIVVNDLFYLTQQGVELRTTDPRGTSTLTQFDNGVLANDRDVEGDSFTARLTQSPTLGRVTLNSDGTFTYVPNAGTLKGAVDTFRYEAVDILGAVSTAATVNVTITNPPPPKHQNPITPLDVNADGFISPIDVLLIVNFLNFSGASSVSVVGIPDPPPYRDVNGNNFIDPLDVLEVINFINARGNRGAGEGEGATVSSGSLAAPLTWKSDVMRDSLSIGVTMVDVPVLRLQNAAKPYVQSASPATAFNLAQYLESFASEDDDEADQLAFLTSKTTTEGSRESLDAVFAQVFGQ